MPVITSSFNLQLFTRAKFASGGVAEACLTKLSRKPDDDARLTD